VERFAESVDAVSAYAGRMLLRCPGCGGLAVGVRGEKAPQQPLPVRVTCGHCGFAKEWRTLGDGSVRDAPTPVRDMVCDHITGLALWLQAPCAGHRLWAFNEEHLDFLRRAIGASLRERATYLGWDGRERIDTYYGRIPAALPTWMKLAKHRDEVLTAIAKMADTLP
jgi:hypothetical protein